MRLPTFIKTFLSRTQVNYKPTSVNHKLTLAIGIDSRLFALWLKQMTMNNIQKLMPVSLVVKAFREAIKLFVADKYLVNDMMSQFEGGMNCGCEEKPKLLFLKGKGEDVCVNLKDLVWIQADGSYVRFHCVNGTSKIMSGSLQAVMLQLCAGGVDYIIRIHNSHAVNLYHITGRCGYILFIGKTNLSVSAKYRKSFSKYYIDISKTV